MANQGTKNRSEQILSKIIRDMANEPTEDGAKTRAEALAEVVWKFALGWREDCGEGKIKIWPPAKWAIDLVYERAEGRAAQVGGDTGKTRDPAEKISQQMRERLNRFVEQGENNDRSKKTPLPPTRKIEGEPSEKMPEVWRGKIS